MSTAASGATVSSRRNTRDVFGVAGTVPPLDIGLPQGLCITAIEFLTYLPNSIRNYEPLLRFVQAGIDHGKFARIVNFHRHLEKPALDNSCGTIIRNTMREGTGDETWSMGAHKNNYTYDRVWTGDELTFDNVELDCHRYAAPAMKANIETGKIAFADLATNIQVHPSYSRGDGFMLTRCVQYAAANPDKEYLFPDDYLHLMRKLYDGRRLTHEHYDKASFRRWKKRKAAQSYGSPEVETFNNVLDSDDDSDGAELGFPKSDSEGSCDLPDSDAELMDVDRPVGTPVSNSHTGFPPQVPPMTDSRRSYNSFVETEPMQQNVLPSSPPFPGSQFGQSFVNNAAPSHALGHHTANRNGLPSRSLPVTAGGSVHNPRNHLSPVEQMGMLGRPALPTIHMSHRSVHRPALTYEVSSSLGDDWDLEDAPAPPVARDFMFEDMVAPHSFMAHVAGQNNFLTSRYENAHRHMDDTDFSEVAEHYNFQLPVNDNAHSPTEGN